MGASVVAGGDAAPVFEAAKHALNLVAVFVECGVVFDRVLSMPASRDAGRDALGGQGGAEPVAVVAPIGDQAGGSGERRHEGRRPAIVADLPGREQQSHGLAGGVADRVQLGGQPAARAAETAG